MRTVVEFGDQSAWIHESIVSEDRKIQRYIKHTFAIIHTTTTKLYLQEKINILQMQSTCK